MKTRFAEIANRITGLSVPIFGIQWDPPTLDTQVARELLIFLENKRVLYTPYELEVPRFAIESILQIRQRLSDNLEKLKPSSPLAKSIRAMRAACRKFLDRVEALDLGRPVGAGLGMLDSMIFLSAIGELRGVCGIYISQIAISYGVDVEGELASIFPLLNDKD